MADLSVLMPLITGAGIFFVVLMGFAALFKAFYVKVEQGTALIVAHQYGFDSILILQPEECLYSPPITGR